MKVVFISSMLPSGHFSQILTSALKKQKNLKLIVYADENPANLAIKNCGKIKTVWSRTAKFIFEILSQIKKDKPDVIHLQQEFTMYGTFKNAFLFPFLPLLLRMMGGRVIITIHAAVYKNQINQEFIQLFTTKRSSLIAPITLKIFFYYTFKLLSLFSNAIICHTHLLKDILTSDWGVDANKVFVISTGIPQKKMRTLKKKNYFFYYGYLVRRKGLEYVFKGFADFIKKYKSYQLIIAGGIIKGQEAAFEEIKEMMAKFALSQNVKIRGFIDDEKELEKLYCQAYAVVIPAKVSMGSSGPLYHAQSYGKCILASNVGHFREDINHLYDGVLVDNEQWRNVFQFVVRHPEVVKEIEKNVRAKAQEKSSIKIAQKHLELYKQILKFN
jgi:glycosyltransferase involved in cell wall biosynthesis